MLLSAVSVLAVAQSSSEIPEGHMNNPVYRWFRNIRRCQFKHYSLHYCFRCCSIADKSTVLLQKRSTYVTAYYIICPFINFICTLAKNYLFCAKYLDFINQIFWDWLWRQYVQINNKAIKMISYKYLQTNCNLHRHEGFYCLKFHMFHKVLWSISNYLCNSFSQYDRTER